MKKRTKALYDEWSRLDAVLSSSPRNVGKKARAELTTRKARVGSAISRTRKIEDLFLAKKGS